MAKRSTAASNTAKVVQFPLCLCFAATSHKFQGQTIVKPNKVADDLKSVFQAAQAYTILSRAQSIEQVYIIGSLPEEKIYADPTALKELSRLDNISVNKNPPLWEQAHGETSINISCLNCCSLKARYKDIEADPILALSDLICLSEIWDISSTMEETIKLDNFELHVNSYGQGKGVASYHKVNKFFHRQSITAPLFQIMVLSSSDVDVITIYRSQGADNEHLADIILSLIDFEKTVIVCGDMNICYKEQKNNKIIQTLEAHGFEEKVQEATHIKGGHIDHVYFRSVKQQYKIEIFLYSPFYTALDHDALCFTLVKREDIE